MRQGRSRSRRGNTLKTRTKSVVVAAVALFVVIARVCHAQREHPITEVLRPDGVRVLDAGARFTVTLVVTIPRNVHVWHLYSITQPPGGPIRTQITVLPGSLFRVAGPIIGTAPEVADDPNFGIMTETYTDSAFFMIPIVSSPAASGSSRLIVRVYYQTCNDKYCLPPAVDTLGLTVRFTGRAVARSEWNAGGRPLPAAPWAPPSMPAPYKAIALPIPGSAVGVARAVQSGVPITTLPGNGSLGLFLWIAATMGALSLLTPCVFPMVPITISYFSRGESRGRGRAFRDAGVYAAGIVAAFTSLGLGLAVILGTTGLNRFAANPWLNLAIAALFAGFALSLFGVVDLAVPGSVLTKVDRLTRGSRFGRDGTTLLMGATFALTSFTCTAPFVGTLLVSATQGNWKWPAMGLLTFSAVFALPFLVLALVPEALARLPRSGEWMVTMKGSLAFLELAAAVKFLSNADLVQGWGIFTRNLVLLTWIVLGVCLVAYLLGVRPRRNGEAQPRRYPIPSVLVVAIVAWLSTGLAGWRLGELEPFLPPAGVNGSGVANGGELSWILDDYPGAYRRAQAEKKLILIDFTGYTCTNCRWMEANMFPRDEVRRELDHFVRVRLFTDGRDLQNEKQQALEEFMFKTVALPLYAVVGDTGRIRATYLGMTRNADEFVRFLASARGGKK